MNKKLDEEKIEAIKNAFREHGWNHGFCENCSGKSPVELFEQYWNENPPSIVR